MKLTDIIWTDKMRAVMRDNSQVLFLCGATGCSKSLVAGHKFMDRLNCSKKDETQFYIICKDIGTGVRNIIQNEDSFYNLYSFMRTEYTANKEGGGQFRWKTPNGDKIVYLVGADNKESWSKILGSNPNGLWLEELSVLHIDCIREAMGRSLSRRCWLLGTTNGGLPTQPFYTEFVNNATVMFKETVPSIELKDITNKWDYAHYYHFNLNDDAPHLTDEDKFKLKELYPENSFYYMSKIMGCRGFAQGSAYAMIMEKSHHLIPFDSIELSNLWEINLYVDVGSNRNPEDMTKASTIATLIGYSKGCQRVIVLECWEIPANSHDFIIEECERRIEWWWSRYMQKFQKIVIDSAESILINTWRAKNRFRTITIKGSIKAYKDKINLVTRCELKQQLIMQDRLLWSSRAENNYDAHTRILLNEDGSEMDLGVQDNDKADTVAYGLTEKWIDITTNVKRG